MGKKTEESFERHTINRQGVVRDCETLPPPLLLMTVPVPLPLPPPPRREEQSYYARDDS